MRGGAVPQSEPWPFRSHRTMREVLRDEALERLIVSLRDPRWHQLPVVNRINRLTSALGLDPWPR